MGRTPREQFLFDDDDPKQLGHGVDALRTEGDGLRAKWKWLRGSGARMPEHNKRLPGQISEADLGDGFLLEAVYWHTNYEARMTRYGESMTSHTPGRDWTDDGGEPLVTRVAAQARAERLALEFLALLENVMEKLDG